MADTPETSSSTSLYEVAIGEKNQTHYLDRFEQFDEKGDKFHISWNWAAFFFSGFWAFYRKMYGWFFAMWAFATIINMAEKLNAPPAVGLLYLAPGLYFAIFGNSLYHRKVKAQIASAQKSNIDESRVIKRLNGISGVHTWVLYVFGAIPVLGVVASIAIPAYQDYAKGQASAAKLADAIQTSSGTDWANGIITSPSQTSAAPQNSQIDTFLNQPPKVNPFDQFDEKPTQPIQRASTDAVAQNNRGMKYLTGEGVTKDYVEAVSWFRLAAAQGDAYAQYNLGVSYEKGQGVSKDYVESVRWYRLAAAQGHAYAQSNLGSKYFTGVGVAQDYVESARWYRLAAAQGHADAQFWLGTMYFKGEGVIQDNLRAHMWTNLSAVDGVAYMVKARNAVAKNLTPQQIAQAQQMARECQQRNFKGCD